MSHGYHYSGDNMVLEGTVTMLLESVLIFVWAFIIAVVGYFVATLVERVVSMLYRSFGIKEYMEKTGYEKAVLGIEFEAIVKEVVKWWVFLVFLAQAADILSLYTISGFFTAVLGAYTTAVLALFYFTVGAVLAHYIGEKIKDAGVVGGNATATAVKAVILYISLVTSLQLVGFTGINFLNRIVELLITAVVIAVGLGVGIAIGMGTKDIVKEIVEEHKEKIREFIKK